MGAGRFLAYKPLECAAKLGGKAGVAGVVVGGSGGFSGKLYDGVMAVPNFISYVPNMLRDLDRVDRLDDGFGTIKLGIDYSWEALKSLNFREAYDALQVALDGAKKAYAVAEELDYNGIWNAITNAADNVLNHPVATVVAAGAVYGAGWTLGRAMRFWGTRGQGTIWDRAERRLGENVFRDYFDKKRKQRAQKKPAEPEVCADPDPYAVLGVPAGAAPDEITHAAQEKLYEISLAREMLLREFGAKRIRADAQGGVSKETE